MAAPPKRHLLRQIPPNRTIDSVWRHFEVERSIAARLKAGDRALRKKIYATMYDQLFDEVPDHPRLTRRADEQQTARAIESKSRLVRPFARSDASFLEFGSGDCRFCIAMADRFAQVHAVDIADQIASGSPRPANFELIVYDGYDLDLPSGCIDIAFSDQLIEHLHPDDTAAHFSLVHRLLKPGGVYLFRTPHRLTGPHDVSRYFVEEAQGFHLKEWTYGELTRLLGDLDYGSIRSYWFAKGILLRVPLGIFRMIEGLFRPMPGKLRRLLLPYLLPSIVIAVEK